MRILRTACTYTAWALLALIFSPLLLILSFVLGARRYDNRLYSAIASYVGMLATKAAGARLEILNQDTLPTYPKSPAIIVANHTSALDIPILESLVGSYPHIWLSKIEYGSIPIIGTLLRRMHILVDRNNPRRAAQALSKAFSLAQQGPRHILMFPEGTRSENGNLKPFNIGCAALALKLNRPIIPIYLHNAHHIMPKKNILIHSHKKTIRVILGKPMQPHAYENAALMIQALEEWFEKTKQNEKL